MTERKLTLKGKLFGMPFMASVDTKGSHKGKENSVLIVKENINYISGYSAYIFSQISDGLRSVLTEKNIPFITDVSDIENFIDYDIVNVHKNGVIKITYRADSADNVIFITNKCNSNCIMCPDSDSRRQSDDAPSLDAINRLIELIPDDTPHLCITGGEPTLLQYDFIDILKKCKEKFLNTGFLFLTNGRTLSVPEYAKEIVNTVPNNTVVAIPIYSHIPEKHNKITRGKNSFEQAITGIRNIMEHIDVEIRIVVMKQNYTELLDIANMLISYVPKIKKVSFMGMELLGNAAVNKANIWINYQDTNPYIYKASAKLIKNGISAQIYNYPLCMLDEKLWGISVQSISDYKIRYKSECGTCTVKSNCGGFFFSTINYDKIDVKPIQE